ncbi:hypothetical protein GE09DRAFT_1247962 [Coniochaeta sp. 2T2.1]|nr:hypothetical protein GE09DRAFT_1247962 [Coniochaeta sp. 2T2.1]
MLPTLFTIASLAPLILGAPSSLTLRQEVAKHCVDDNLGPHSTGNLYCVGSDGFTVSCSECLGTDGDDVPALSHAMGGACYITTGGEDGSLGRPVACPGDPPPSKTPDGRDPGGIAGDIIEIWCSVAGSVGAFGWLNWAMCYWYGSASAGNDPLEEGEQFIKTNRCVSSSL